MATNASAQFWVRLGTGNAANGCGYDAGISGAGTNYCDSDTAQASWTSSLTLASGTLTDTGSGGLFTALMIGNAVKVAGQGYYWIMARTDGNNVTVVNATGTAATSFSGASGKVGGGSSLGSTLAGATSPVIGGNTINVRGSGSNDPATADVAIGGTYWDFSSGPTGNSTTGRINWVGYNGRPCISYGGLIFFTCTLHNFANFKGIISGTGFPTYGFVGSSTECSASNLIIDQASFDCQGIGAEEVVDSEFRNSGGGAAGTNPAIGNTGFGGRYVGNTVNRWRGPAMSLDYRGHVVLDNIIVNNISDGISLSDSSGGDTSGYGVLIEGNTIDNNAGHGIVLADARSVMHTSIRNNQITGHVGSGKFGLKTSVTAALANALVPTTWDYNNFSGNTTDRSGCSAGPHDTALAPAYTSTTNGLSAANYTVGTAGLKTAGFPGTIRGSSTPANVAIGAANATSGGGNTYSRGRVVNASS
jgi:hypothetical protein